MNLSRSKGRELNEYEAAAKRLQARLGDAFSGEDIAWEVRRNRWELQFKDVLAGLRRAPEHPDKICSIDTKRRCGLLGEDREYVREMMIREYQAWRNFARRHAPHLLAIEPTAEESDMHTTPSTGVTWFK